jgi:hypothetical protein
MPERHKRGVRHRLEDKDGEYLYRSALFKVFVGKRIFKFPFRAPANQAYSEANILDLEDRVVNYIDKKLSRLEFRRVQVGPNAVNFIACGTKPPQGAQDAVQKEASGGGSNTVVQERGPST